MKIHSTAGAQQVSVEQSSYRVGADGAFDVLDRHALPLLRDHGFRPGAPLAVEPPRGDLGKRVAGTTLPKKSHKAKKASPAPTEQPNPPPPAPDPPAPDTEV